MTTILCYGDSNTYGYNPVNGLRYPKDVRWTGVLQKLLGEQYAVIEEGCNGRTTVFEDIAEPWKAGLGYLKPCLNTHKPIDFVIMMLVVKCEAFYSPLRISGWRSSTLTVSVWMRLVMLFTGREILQRDLMKARLILSNA